MYRLQLKKPDGRKLILYSLRPIAGSLVAPSPRKDPVQANPHMRWHPLRGEWVTYAAHRQDRTFLPPPEYNPLLPSDDPHNPTELPVGDYDVACFDNLFPSFSLGAANPPELSVPTLPASGACEVVVFSQQAKGSLGRLPLDHIKLVLDVWAERYTELGKNPLINYVLPFENRGVEVGVTLHHPHGQIYAYPVIPPIPLRQMELQQAYYTTNHRGLLADMVKDEVESKVRLLYNGPHVVAFIPICARYAYETWIAPKRAAPSLAAMSDEEREDLARALKTVLLKFDRLWQKPFPYLMCIHQAPTDGQPHPEAHVHMQFYPPLRTETKLKYLAGTELGAGLFAADSLPEDKAKDLQAVEVSLDV